MSKSTWLAFDKQKLGRRPAMDRLQRVATSFYEDLDCAEALSCCILMRNGEWRQLVEKSVNPLDFPDAFRFRDAYQAVSFLSKYPSLNTGIDTEEVAWNKFLSSELSCKSTNERLRKMRDFPSDTESEIHVILHMASRKISRILGSCPSVDELDDLGWGPGSTTAVGGDDTSPYTKFQAQLDVTRNCFASAQVALGACPSWVGAISGVTETPTPEHCGILKMCVVEGSKLMFVPKNAKTDRAICVEPHLNSFIQRGIGRHIRKRLSRSGCDLSTQSNNQEAALLGSITGHLATIDLSSASDTISYELVVELLPYDWLDLLDCARSPATTYKGKLLFLEKFSSMGNGYTFELETLIFLALARSVAAYLEVDSSEILVYGDDIVVPVECYELLVKVFSFCGFSTNDSKSFRSGPFRESCGKDYYLGTDVRPIFLKEELSDVESLYKLANSIRRLAHRRNFSCGCDSRLFNSWSDVVDRIPRPLRYKIPEGFGDSGLISNWDEARPRPSMRKHGWQGFAFDCVRREPVRKQMTDPLFTYVAALYGAGKSPDLPTYGSVTFRRRTHLVRHTGYAFKWYNLGGWI